MSHSEGSTRDIDIVLKKQKKRSFFGNLFRKDIEVSTDKLMQRMGTSAGKKSAGTSEFRWEVTKSGLVELIKAKCKVPPNNMPLASLKLSIWCDLPKPLWDEFSRDAQFLADLANQVNSHMDRMVQAWAEISDSAEKEIPKIGKEKALENFQKTAST